MARIRSIKPDFFRHEGLFEAELESGLPLRLAYAGLWTTSDREGRFKWSPRQLKLDCLPYDEVDFSRVLDALATRGFIVKYRSDGSDYGFIPSWKQHQVINNREAESTLPEPNENNTLTRSPRVLDACSTPLEHAQGEGKGRGKEGEGKGNSEADASEPRAREVARPVDDWPPDYRDQFWDRYPNKIGKPKALAKLEGCRKRGVPFNAIMDGLDRYIRTKPPDRQWLNPETFINQERWNDQPAPVSQGISNERSGTVYPHSRPQQSGSDAVLAGVAAAVERRARERIAAGQDRPPDAKANVAAVDDPDFFGTG